MRFHGWPDQAYAVLLELGGEPSLETRERVRRGREEFVRKPMIDLLNDLADADSWYEDFAVWRYASTAWWWQNQCGIVRVAPRIVIAFRFNLDSLRIAASWQYADPEQVVRFRAATADDQSGSALADLLASLTATGHKIRGDVMKRTPRGYPADHARADLLRYRSLTVRRELDAETVQDVDPVYRECERLRPLLEWFSEHVAVALPEREIAAGQR
jgi:hypothetical protein